MSGSKKKIRKKKKSKITPPSNPNESKLVAFRADAELSMMLKRTSNKSEVIINALREYFGKYEFVTCTRCKGKGKMRRKKKSSV